jgi:hypothetical protein
MRICEQCGTANGDDAEFCGGCGEFLEWDDGAGTPAGPATSSAAGTAGTATAVATHPATQPATHPATQATTHPGPATPPGTTPSGVDTAAGTVWRGAAAGPADQATATAHSAEVTGSAASQGTYQSTDHGTTATPPVQPTGPAPVQPGQRAVHRVRPQQAVVEEPPVAPGQIACPACGVGNDPTRRFCRRCGTSLATATVVRLSWWRRLLNWLRGRRRGHDVGYRPRGRRQGGGRIWPVLVFLLAAVLAVAAIPNLRGYVGRGIGAVRDRINGIAQVDPVRATASSGSKYPAANIKDGANNIFWAPDKPAPDAVNEWVALDLAKPVRLEYLVFTTGVSTSRQEFLSQARPENVELTLTSTGGQTRTVAVRLQDKTGEQKVALTGDGVTKIQVTIKSAYGAQPGRLVAIAELEVFVRG